MKEHVTDDNPSPQTTSKWGFSVILFYFDEHGKVLYFNTNIKCII